MRIINTTYNERFSVQFGDVTFADWFIKNNSVLFVCAIIVPASMFYLLRTAHLMFGT